MEKSLFYPNAINWMWDYCIFLGSFITSSGNKYDLGIYIDERRNSVSGAIVYDDNEGSYLSGELERFGMGDNITDSVEYYEETRRRAKNLGYYTGKLNENVK